MLKTNSKIVRQAVRQHILDTIEINELVTDVDNLLTYVPKQNHVPAAASGMGQYMVDSGYFLCYYSSAREFLKETLQETDEEANKYSDEKVWQLYRHLIGREVGWLYDNRSKVVSA